MRARTPRSVAEHRGTSIETVMHSFLTTMGRLLLMATMWMDCLSPMATHTITSGHLLLAHLKTTDTMLEGVHVSHHPWWVTPLHLHLLEATSFVSQDTQENGLVSGTWRILSGMVKDVCRAAPAVMGQTGHGSIETWVQPSQMVWK